MDRIVVKYRDGIGTVCFVDDSSSIRGARADLIITDDLQLSDYLVTSTKPTTTIHKTEYEEETEQ